MKVVMKLERVRETRKSVVYEVVEITEGGTGLAPITSVYISKRWAGDAKELILTIEKGE